MKCYARIVVWELALFASVAGFAKTPASVTFESLLSEMTDLRALSRFPDPAYVTRQFSSYDRRSTDPSVLTDENWFANADRGHHLRAEERNGAAEYVLMDAAGPGAIVRFWSANPNDAGVVRVYLDGAETPAIEMTLHDILGASGAAPFLHPISHEASRGWNTYLPIPYAKHCKVTTDKHNYYYIIDYRTYGPGTRVETFSMELAAKHAARIQETAEALAQPYRIQPASRRKVNWDVELGGQAAVELNRKVRRPHAITGLECRIAAADVEKALRETVLTVHFDKEKTPSIEAPLGDFFGGAPGLPPFEALPCGILEDGTLYSRWVMPFRRRAHYVLRNTGSQPVKVSLTADLDRYEWTSDSLYFHAKWRNGIDIPTRPRQDWSYLKAAGKGRFVGVMLHIANPVTNWWGEGDEKIYVDGEKFPSFFGTGSEDYFGYAWGSPELYTHAYHNQPRCDGPGTYGNNCENRFHILDNIPFTKSIQFDMEIWHWNDCQITQGTMAYWYAAPGGTDFFERVSEARLPVIPPASEPKRVKDTLEGERLEVLSVSGGKTTVQHSSGWDWSNEAQLWWTGGKPGDTLTVSFPAPAAAKYEIVAVFTKAVDYGIAEITVNKGKPIARVDFFNDGVVPTGEISLGAHELKPQGNTLTIRIMGANPKAVPGYMAGIDYIRLIPAAE